MKKLLAAALVALAFAAATAGSASAAVSWPASCSTMTCVNTHMNNLDSRLRSQTTTTATLKAQVTDLQDRVASLEAFKASANAKLNCIAPKNVWREQFYNSYQGYWQYYLDISSGTSPYGDAAGPFRLLTESTTSACVGTF